MYQQGDIVAVKFPFSDVSTIKKRPAIIISLEKVNQTGDYIMIQITSKEMNDGFSVEIENSDISPVLPLKSFARSHKVFTLHKSLILSKIGESSSSFLDRIVVALNENIKVQV